jgi:hypothetical protein
MYNSERTASQLWGRRIKIREFNTGIDKEDKPHGRETSWVRKETK